MKTLDGSTGGCLCGQFRYELSGTPIAMFNCHCRDCQQSTGAASSPVIYMGKSGFKVLQGKLKHYFTDSMSGGKNKRGFCGECGARICGGESDRGIGILASSLDDPSVFVAQDNINVADAQPWDRERTVRALFEAFISVDKDRAETLLTDDFTFTSPYDDAIDKATYYARCWPNSDHIEEQIIEEVAPAADGAFVRYRCRLKDGKRFRNTEYFTFDGNRIRAVEVFFGREDAGAGREP